MLVFIESGGGGWGAGGEAVKNTIIRWRASWPERGGGRVEKEEGGAEVNVREGKFIVSRGIKRLE